MVGVVFVVIVAVRGEERDSTEDSSLLPDPIGPVHFIDISCRQFFFSTDRKTWREDPLPDPASCLFRTLLPRDFLA